MRAWIAMGCLVVVVAAAGCTTAEQRFDADGDGWEDLADCGPQDPTIYPDAEDPIGDGVDQDCDGADGTAVPAVAIYPAEPGTDDDLRLQVVTEAPSWSVTWLLDEVEQPSRRSSAACPRGGAIPIRRTTSSWRSPGAWAA
jgi:hypothetical protein